MTLKITPDTPGWIRKLVLAELLGPAPSTRRHPGPRKPEPPGPLGPPPTRRKAPG